MQNCFLVLANGCVFEGQRFGADKHADGELVFTTSSSHMSALTDPCYAGQIVLHTSPLIGNYGVVSSEMDADHCSLNGYIVKEWCDYPVNFQSEGDIDSFLKEHDIAGVCGVDTRQITRILRNEGTMRAAIADAVTPELIAQLNEPLPPVTVKPAERALYPADNSNGKLVLIDCGAVHGAIAALNGRGYDVCVLPNTASIDQVMNEKPKAVLISDGPGDPSLADAKLIALIQAIKLPMLGLGYGHLLIAGAHGAPIRKLHHGHRGVNQPIQRTADSQVFICSLNQGYATDVPENAKVSFRNVNDGSVAGLVYDNALSVQFVPDPTLGPLRTDFIYDEWLGKVVD